MIKVNSKTRLVGLLGYPLGHSFSPDMQNAAFGIRGINNVYVPIEVKPDDLGTVVKALPGMNFIGFNITIPYKGEIIKYLDELDESAKHIGAVNTVVIKNGMLKGYNTDASGFMRSLKEGLGSGIEGRSIFVLGSGGASRAVCMALAFDNAAKIYICNRTYEKAKALSEDINSHIPGLASAVPMEWVDMERAIDKSDVLVNTTSIGMFPNIDETPIDSSLLKKELLVYDVIYNPQKTKLLEEAERLGCRTISGMGMLVYQGAEAFELWTETEAPVEIMFDALEEALGIKI